MIAVSADKEEDNDDKHMMNEEEDDDKEDGEGITDQLSQFYSEIEVAPEPESREETPDTQTEDDNASVPDESAPSLQSSEPSSPQQPDSPLPNQPRKRKKVPIRIYFAKTTIFEF